MNIASVKRQRIRQTIILISFFLFPASYYYFSPVLVLESSYQGIINGSFMIFALLFASSFVFGRGFCGWLCPAAGCQEAIFAANPTNVISGNYIKWLIWVPWLSAIAFCAFNAGGYRQSDFFYKTVYGISINDLQSSLTYFGVLLILIVLPGFIIGKRSFCHHLCWMAPFMITGRKLSNILKIPSLRLQSRPENCRQCQSCTHLCPMSLPVRDMVEKRNMENSECILCGTCVDVCPGGTIRFSVKNKQLGQLTSKLEP